MRCQSPSFQRPRENAGLETSDHDIDFADNWPDDGSDDHPIEDCQIQWTEMDDVNLDAAHLETDWSANEHTDLTDSSEECFSTVNLQFLLRRTGLQFNAP